MLGLIALSAAVAKRPHILFIVADDLGRNDLAIYNGNKSKTDNIDGLITSGIALDSYYTFKVCAPSRTSIMTGRYPWNTGYYDMVNDDDHCVDQGYEMLGDKLKKHGNYSTHAIGKWDVGKIGVACTATWRGFDSFMGYYSACNFDYFTHNATCNSEGLTLNEGKAVAAVPGALGRYSTHLYTARAVSLVQAHAAAASAAPLFVYLAYQNVHLACGPGKPHGVQAPCSSVDLFPNVVNDTYKAQAANMLELDRGVGEVVGAFKSEGLWDDTLVVFVSDNGGPLDHTTNFPLRGGKHTFWEGGVRVVSFVSGGKNVLPELRRGTTYHGMLHSSDWMPTLINGFDSGGDGGSSNSTNNLSNGEPTPLDGYDVWTALRDNTESPRTEVVHQVKNQYFNDSTTGYAIRVGDYKLIVGDPGDSRVLAWPDAAPGPIEYGTTGGLRDTAHNACRAPSGKGAAKIKSKQCVAASCLFDVVRDPSESHDLAANASFAGVLANLTARLAAAAARGPSTSLAYPYSMDEDKQRAGESCAAAKLSGFWQPSDAPPLPPQPTPPPTPPLPTPAPSATCSAAGGIQSKIRLDVCCMASCGTCGGSNCGKLPGGNAGCCCGEIRKAGKKCDPPAVVAPCLLPALVL